MRSKQKYSFTIFVVVVCLALAVPARATVTKRLYIDGVLTGSNAVPGQLAYTYDRITIACEGNQWYMYNSLQGGLDEFAIYDGVLSNTDVLDHYNAAQVDEPNYVAEVCSDNPQIYLRLNDAIKANGAPAVRDSCSAVNRDGTYINTVIPAPGIFAPNDLCAVFAGDLPDANLMGCIDIWDGDRVLAFDEVSIEVWVNSTHLYDNYPRLFQHNGGWLNENAYGATCIDGNGPNNPGGEYAGVIGAMDTSYFATGNINDGTWHHVVVTYEYTYELNGYDTEVMKDNPLIWFRFEEEIGRDVNVVNHGSRYVEAKYVGHNPHFAPGKVGKGVYLHDTGDEAIIIFSPAYTGGANYSHLYALTPGDMSVEVWFRARPFYEYNEDGELNWARLYSNNGTYTNKDSARTYLTASGYLTGAGSKGTYAQTYLYTEHPGFNPSAPEPSLTGPADGDWHHVVVTYNVDDIDPNNSPPVVIQFYLDGALLGSRLIDLDAIINTTGIMGPEFREFVIGADGSSDGERWNCFLGTLDEFALYDHVLPQDRIIIHYQEGMAAQPWVPENCEDIYTFGWNISADKNGDCYVNFKDIIDMSKDWWRCIEPIDESCEKPWSH